MVWESGCTVIVMLTPLVEDGVKQCDRYWPDEGSSLYHVYEVSKPHGQETMGVGTVGGAQFMHVQLYVYINIHVSHIFMHAVPWCSYSLSHVQLFETPWTVACQAPLSWGFSRQEYWSGLPCASPGDLPNPRIEPRSPELQVDSLLSEPPGKHSHTYIYAYTCVYVCVQSRAEKHL